MPSTRTIVFEIAQSFRSKMTLTENWSRMSPFSSLSTTTLTLISIFYSPLATSAFVTVKPAYRSNPPTEAQLIAHVASRLPKQSIPSIIYISDEVEIERNINGKVVKTSIKARMGDIWTQRKNQKAKL